jgi:hypothetical protein
MGDGQRLEIRISVDRAEIAEMTYGQREKLLGGLAEEQLAQIVPPRHSESDASRRNRWKPYTRETIALAFKKWSRLNDGRAPSKADWSAERDPDSQWPRPESETFRKALEKTATEDGISLSTTAPHRNDPEHEARAEWHTANYQYERAQTEGNDAVTLGNWGRFRYLAPDGEDPGPYCLDCFHGSGCKPPDMSLWQYAVEVIGDLRMRIGSDFHATRSERDRFGRNRQMVTGGAADVHPRSSDPAAGRVIETLTPRRR